MRNGKDNAGATQIRPSVSLSPAARKQMFARDFNQNPFIVIWEMTRACQLHCLHCRAEAQRRRNPNELTTEEAVRLMDEIAAMDKPLLVFTGGDPLERPDLFELIQYGTSKGLEVAMTPSATPRVTREALQSARDAGLARCAFSLDGSTPEIHDRFRGTSGSYALTMQALQDLRDIGMPIQVNTTVSRYNIDDLPKIADIVEQFGAVLWSLFFLIPTGRGRAKDMIDAETAEQVMEWLYEQSVTRSFGVKTTEAPHYRRILLGHRSEHRQNDPLRALGHVGDGNGFVFVSHTGDVYPSGFLPLNAGNIRTRSLADIYRNSSAFQDLRNPDLLQGKCGACEFRKVCGGSRSRAYAMTGNPLASDELCAYIPPAYQLTESVQGV